MSTEPSRQFDVPAKLGLTKRAAQLSRVSVAHRRRGRGSIQRDRLLSRWMESPKRFGHRALPLEVRRNCCEKAGLQSPSPRTRNPNLSNHSFDSCVRPRSFDQLGLHPVRPDAMRVTGRNRAAAEHPFFPRRVRQRRSPERDRDGGPPPSDTYGSKAISRARLIATAICRWCLRQAPLIRRDRIFPRSDVYRRSCSTFL